MDPVYFEVLYFEVHRCCSLYTLVVVDPAYFEVRRCYSLYTLKFVEGVSDLYSFLIFSWF